VQATSPVHGLPVEVLLVERRPVLRLFQARWGGRHAHGVAHSVASFLVLVQAVSEFIALSLHLLELIKPNKQLKLKDIK
jgi:hypothetical protein